MKKIFLFFIIVFSASIAAQSEEYKRIVSLAPSVTKSLYELDIDKNIIGITIYCPEGKYKKEIVGTFLDPDLEKIISLKPDLIIASKDGNNKISVEKLQKIGFNIYVMEASKNFEDICKNFILLAKAAGKENLAQEIVKKAKTQVEDIEHKSKLLKAKTVFWEIGSKPLYAAGKYSFLNSYNKYANTKNIYEDILKAAYSPVDIEDVLIRNPDIIFIADMDPSAEYSESEIKKYASCNAGKNNKIYILKSDELFGLTPLAFVKALKDIAAIVDDKNYDKSHLELLKRKK